MDNSRFTLSLLAASLACLGCNQHQSTTTTAVAPPQSAARLHAAIETAGVPAAEPGQMTVSGSVIGVNSNSIEIKTEQSPDGITKATSADVKVWEDGKLVELSSLEPGDRVDLFTEQRGNRMDGYQSLIVRINIAYRADQDGGSTKDYSRTIRGIVVKADSNAVTIQNPEDSGESQTTNYTRCTPSSCDEGRPKWRYFAVMRR